MAILSRFTIAANFWKGVVEQVLGLLHHVSKVQRPLMHIYEEQETIEIAEHHVYVFLSESGSEACMIDGMFVFRGPNTAISEKVSCRHVRLSS